MKRYIISGPATLSFADGRRVALEAGIHSHPDDVAAHWAFKHHAQALDETQSEDAPVAGENQQDDTGAKLPGVDGEKDKGNGKK
jgi:hypothetical protein